MTKQEYINFSLNKGLKFTSVLDEIEGMPLLNRMWTCNGVLMLFGDFCLNTVESDDTYPVHSCKIIARPLSDLEKPIEHKGEKFIPIVELAKMRSVYLHESEFDRYLGKLRMDILTRRLPFDMFQELIKWHFAVWLDENEYVDVNTLDANPYA